MAPTLVLPGRTKQLEDPLDHLPCSAILEYRKGQTIYLHDQPSTSLHLVIDGKVRVSRLGNDGDQVLIDIYQRDDFFGESVLLNLPNSGEQATALEDCKLMTWGTAALEELIMRRPRLGVALLQILVQRTTDFTKRLEGFCVDNIECRLARSLIRFSARFGTLAEDGSVNMMAFTHEVLAQYVGTSREIVTHYMNAFRRNGYLSYSRKGITLQREALREWLRNPSSGKLAAATASSAA